MWRSIEHIINTDKLDFNIIIYINKNIIYSNKDKMMYGYLSYYITCKTALNIIKHIAWIHVIVYIKS